MGPQQRTTPQRLSRRIRDGSSGFGLGNLGFGFGNWEFRIWFWFWEFGVSGDFASLRFGVC